MIALLVAIGTLLLVAIGTLFSLVRNEVAFKNRGFIVAAIFSYHMREIDANKSMKPATFEVEYSDMESYERTMWRIWDWGYKRILPPEKFELIKPYIKKGE